VEEPTAVKGTLTAPGPLVLTPTELVLVDGRKVQGQLACELEGHLVLYSPGLGTLASFRKEFVASYTKGGQAVTVTALRKLTPEEQRLGLNNWTDWPDAVPETGPKPAYTTQKWGPPKRLLIWNKLAGGPKKNGSFSRFGRGEEDSNVACMMGKTGDAGSWLVLGAPGTTWDVETDVLLPGVDLDQAYLILASERLRFRHFSAENHALLHANHAGMSIQGNVWIHERGRCQENSVADSTFEGPYHTFILNERPPVYTIKEKSFRIDESWKPWKAFTWDAYGYRLSQYIFVKKDRGASLEFRGSFFAGDKFWCFSGTTILGPGSCVVADTRNGDFIMKDATLQVMSGAHWGKGSNMAARSDFEIDGTLEFGTKERPLTKDVVVGVSTKQGGLDSPGFDLRKQGRMRVVSADPKTARVIFQYLDRDPSKTAKLPISFRFLGEAELDGVVFEDLLKGGIVLGDLSMKDKWKNITFAPSCMSQKPEDNYVLYQQAPSTK